MFKLGDKVIDEFGFQGEVIGATQTYTIEYNQPDAPKTIRWVNYGLKLVIEDGSNPIRADI